MTASKERRVLLDIGAHIGESLRVALNGMWLFDHVHSFEPDELCANQITKTYQTYISDEKLTIHNFGLGSSNRTSWLFGDNSKGGSSLLKSRFADNAPQKEISIVDINKFIKDLDRRCRIFIKINCEGAETEIVSRLSELENIENIRSIMADFDVVKVAGGYWKKRAALRKAARRGLPIMLAEHVMVGANHEQRLSNWFAHFPELSRRPVSPKPQLLKRRIRYLIRDARSAVGARSARQL